MATIEIIRHKVSGYAPLGGTLPIADGQILGQKIVTLSGVSQKLSDVDASLVAGQNEAWTVIVSGGPARIVFGDAAGAVVATTIVGWPLASGASKPFAVPKGFTASVIDG